MQFSSLDYKFSMDSTHFEISSASSGIFMSPVPLHKHSLESYEFHIVTGGQGIVKIGGCNYELSENTVYITGPEVIHEQVPNISNPMSEHCFYFRISDNHKSNQSRETDFESYIALFRDHSFYFNRHCPKLRILSDQIITELEHQSFEFDRIVISLFQILVIEFSRLFREERESTVTRINLTNEAQMLSIIETQFMHHYKSITLSALSQTLNLSERQTERILRKYYNTTFMNKRMEARIYASTHLLTTTHIPLTSIANNVGYTTVNHFSYAFKKVMGTSPGKYRKSM